MTIYDDLKRRLGREPSHTELCREVKRILAEAAGTYPLWQGEDLSRPFPDR